MNLGLMRSNRSKQKELKFSYMCTFFRDDLTKKNNLKFRNIMRKLINNKWVTFMIIEGHTKVNIRELVNGYPEEKGFDKFLDTDEARVLGMDFYKNDDLSSDFITIVPSLHYALWVDIKLFVELSRVVSEIDQENNKTLNLFNSRSILKEVDEFHKYIETSNNLYNSREIYESFGIDADRFNIIVNILNSRNFDSRYLKCIEDYDGFVTTKWTETGKKALWDLARKEGFI